MPSASRPHRPARWLALAWLIGSIGSRWTFVRWLYRDIRAVPVSTTYRIPGTVNEVSATLVDNTIRRPSWRPNTVLLAADSRPNSGSTPVAGRFSAVSASAASRISLPERNTRMSWLPPSPATRSSSSTASTIPVTWSTGSAPSSCSSGR